MPIRKKSGNLFNDPRTFSLRTSLLNKPTTRRGILSMVAAIYDPLGFLSPFTRLGKRILQEMCQRGIKRDELLSKGLEPMWKSWVKDFKNLGKISIPRCFKPKNFGKILSVELHHFLNTSSRDYGQCTYIRLIGEDKVHCTLRLIDLVGRVFANGPGNLGLIPGRVIPKT